MDRRPSTRRRFFVPSDAPYAYEAAATASRCPSSAAARHSDEILGGQLERRTQIAG